MACLTTRPVVDIVTSRPRLDGVSTFRPTVPQASFMVSLFLYPVFREPVLERTPTASPAFQPASRAAFPAAPLVRGGGLYSRPSGASRLFFKRKRVGRFFAPCCPCERFWRGARAARKPRRPVPEDPIGPPGAGDLTAREAYDRSPNRATGKKPCAGSRLSPPASSLRITSSGDRPPLEFDPRSRESSDQLRSRRPLRFPGRSICPAARACRTIASINVSTSSSTRIR